uniref:Uncharacterized protein n=1 Tax=Rhizophora mucronata TaxID=61149 RepID=A0A2P2Q1R5_RHIMU
MKPFSFFPFLFFFSIYKKIVGFEYEICASVKFGLSFVELWSYIPSCGFLFLNILEQLAVKKVYILLVFLFLAIVSRRS